MKLQDYVLRKNLVYVLNKFLDFNSMNNALI